MSNDSPVSMSRQADGELARLLAEAKREHCEFLTSYRRTWGAWLRLAHILAQARPLAKRGEWGPFLGSVGISRATASRMVRAARDGVTVGQLESGGIAGLSPAPKLEPGAEDMFHGETFLGFAMERLAADSVADWVGWLESLSGSDMERLAADSVAVWAGWLEAVAVSGDPETAAFLQSRPDGPRSAGRWLKFDVAMLDAQGDRAAMLTVWAARPWRRSGGALGRSSA